MIKINLPICCKLKDADLDKDIISEQKIIPRKKTPSSRYWHQNSVNPMVSHSKKAIEFTIDNNVRVKLSEPTIIPRDDSEYVDYSAEIKGITTKFITSKFLSSHEIMTNFLWVISNAFSARIVDFIAENKLKNGDITFMYKGGNVLRFVALKYLTKFPGNIEYEFVKMYGDAIGKSDADFQIFVNNNIQNYDEIHKKTRLMSLSVLAKLRDFFVQNKGKYFNFYKLDKSYREEQLSKCLEDINKSECIGNPKSPFYQAKFMSLKFSDDIVGSPKHIPRIMGRHDIFITTDPEGNTLTYPIYINDKVNRDEMFVSLNEEITIDNPSALVHFALSRIKFNFSSICIDKNNNEQEINIPAELIDVSIPYRDDSNAQHFNVDRHTKLYNIIMDDDKYFTVRAYNKSHIIDDLSQILFIQNKFPWMDTKYMKRLKRLLIFCFFGDIYRFSIETNIHILKNISKVMNELEKMNDKTAIVAFSYAQLTELIESLKTVQSLKFTNKSSSFHKFFIDMKEIIRKMEHDIDFQMSDFTNYVACISKVINDFLKYTQQIKTYMSRPFDEVADENDVIAQMGGNRYRNKYIKYKTKYLQLKSSMH